MHDIDTWRQKKNSHGGFDPKTPEEKKKFKHADLITLPESVKGTNCFNCRFIKDVKNGIGHCSHPDLDRPVTGRMCCVYWDNPGVRRKF